MSPLERWLKRAEKAGEQLHCGTKQCPMSMPARTLADVRKNGSAAQFNQLKLESKMGCCSACARNNGHFSPSNPSLIRKLKRRYKFDRKTGFWRKGKGCILPRHVRSPICLGFVYPGCGGPKTIKVFIDFAYNAPIYREHDALLSRLAEKPLSAVLSKP